MTIKPVLVAFADFISWWAAFCGSTAIFAALWPALSLRRWAAGKISKATGVIPTQGLF